MHVSAGMDTFYMKAKQGSTIHTAFMGSVQYRLLNFLYEFYNPVLHDITGVFESRRVDTYTNEETDCLAVVCMQLNPASPTQEERSIKSSFEAKREKFMADLDPDTNGKCIECVNQIQDHTGFFPSGYLHLFAMEKPAGGPISHIVRDLTNEDLMAIKNGLFEIQKHTKRKSYSILVDEKSYPFINSRHVYSRRLSSLGVHEHNIWYDRENKRVCLPDRSVLHRHSCQEDFNIELAVVRSEFWPRLVEEASRHFRAKGEEEEQEYLAPAAQKVTLCFRTRDAGVDNGWTMVDVASN
ncbi:hypothetical protein UA08_02018 [Talaromyces atroroseus]|uniref:Uncharacterized protein n=1 Tax=Talaromyces atroroseus TaxID=1441469 RepID=A0A1Q5QCI2_TALAT|nr:hypothetical protein UA08_02018 [Talaromyces atroroseus]OKL63599.1 hypothetical protein UA08_02018 [Talaromyces atroroseus]